MGSTISALSINIVSSLATDLLKRATGASITPVDSAIARTVDFFPRIEGLKGTLEQWLASPGVSEVLDEYTKGLAGFEDLKVEFLAEILLRKTHFFLAEGAEPTAEDIVSRFLNEVRDEYLKTPALGLRLVANRIEESAARSAGAFDTLRAGLEEVKARLPVEPFGEASVFDMQIDEARDHLEKHEYDLAEDRCIKIRQRNWDRLTSRQRFRTLSILAMVILPQERTSEAAGLLIEAKDFQPDDDKALANEAAAYDLLGQNDHAFELATRAKERFPNSTRVLAVWLKTAPSTHTLKDLENAVPAQLAQEVEILSVLAERAFLARDGLRAEMFARRVTTIKPELSYPWLLLGQSIYRSALPDAPDDFARLEALVDKTRFREADEACSKAIALSKIDRHVTVQVGALVVRAEIRGGLGDQSAADEDLIAARSLQPDNPAVLREYARVKLQRGENRDAVEMLRAATGQGDREDLRMLLALALASIGTKESREEAIQMYSSLASGSSLQPAGFRIQAAAAALDLFAKDQRWDEGRKFLTQLPASSLSGAATAALTSRLELAAQNREKSSEWASAAMAAVGQDAGPDDVRLVATVLANLGRHKDALPLWQRLASPRQLGHDTSRLIDCALRVARHDVFLTLCDQLRANGVFDKQLVEVEASVREHYDLEGAVKLLQDYLNRFPEDSSGAAATVCDRCPAGPLRARYLRSGINAGT
ncbi:MAG TPA: hypothetical protein VMT20_06335 [Terriglobia bacterium]|nr:hypothetical protein [Terriglobia bacterium]